METEELQNLNVHHGHNIRRTRIEKDIKQDAMAELVHLSQPAISRYERTKTIDDEILQRFARALNVPVEYLKTLEEDAPSVVFESITNDVHDNKEGVTVPGYSNNQTNAFNPIDKITELYERLLKEKDEKYAALEQRIQNLEKQK
jgi:putative DNA-binding protein